MAEGENILKDKLERLETVPDEFIKAVERSELKLLSEINLLLGEFERDSSGFILTNTRNLALLESLKSRLEQIFVNSDYVKAVRAFAQEIDKQGALSSEYYKVLLDYTESSTLLAMTSQNKRKAVELLIGGAIDKEFFDPIVEVVTESVYTNAPFTETVKAIEVIAAGGQQSNGNVVYGKLSRYARQIAYDQMAIADRLYNQQVSKELGTEFYRYIGGLLSTSRDFCKERNGKFYHKKEIEGWASLTWDGKKEGTNSGTIFTFLGGHKCNHSAVPIPLSLVPKADLIRNLSIGNLTLTDAQREILGV